MGEIAFDAPVMLQDGERIEGFNSGDRFVDMWARKYAHHARGRGTAVVYVVRCGGEVAGFFTLNNHSVVRDDVEPSSIRRNTPSSIPAVELGVLGVDERFKGMGLGRSLLKHAIIQSLKVSEISGAKILVVTPTGEEAAAFYKHFGFQRLTDDGRLFLSLRIRCWDGAKLTRSRSLP